MADVSVVVICEFCHFNVVSASHLHTTGQQLLLLLHAGNYLLFLPGVITV